MKFYRCAKCGKIVCPVAETAAELVCCGETMQELIPEATDGDREKHVPVCSVEKGVIWVRVGTREHPMTEAHHIDWIAVETKAGCQLKYLKPCCYPEAQFSLLPNDEPLRIYAYCNLHALWLLTDRENDSSRTQS